MWAIVIAAVTGFVAAFIGLVTGAMYATRYALKPVDAYIGRQEKRLMDYFNAQQAEINTKVAVENQRLQSAWQEVQKAATASSGFKVN